MSPPLLDLPCITVRGSARQLGDQHGAALRSEIREFVPMRLHAALQWGDSFGVTTAKLVDAGRQCLAVYRAWHPAGYAEHAAIARAAGVDSGELYTAANMTDIRDVVAFGGASPADAEGCSAAILPAGLTRERQIIAAQTWDLNPQDLDFVVAVHRLPDTAPETWSVTCSGCLSLVGMNAASLAVGTTNVKTWGSRPGVGYMGILHRMLSYRRFSDAARVCQAAPRAAAHTYWLADPRQAAEWETTAWSARRRDLQATALLRTNHCLQPQHLIQQGEATTPSSLARLARMTQVVDQRKNHDIDSLRAMFADRSDGVDSINRLPEDAQGTTTNSAVVCVPQTRALWACRGPADRGRWQQLRFETLG